MVVLFDADAKLEGKELIKKSPFHSKSLSIDVRHWWLLS